MALHLVVSRSCNELMWGTNDFKISRISYYSESGEWSTINLCPQFPKKIVAKYLDNIECIGDGLLCFCYGEYFHGYEDKDVDHVIWNPSTDKFQLIPRTDSSNLPCGSCSLTDRFQLIPRKLPCGSCSSIDKFQLAETGSSYLPCGCSWRHCCRSVHSLLWGLGFVAESHDYKFVRFMHNINEVRGERGDESVHYCSNHVAVYSSKNNSWKELPSPFDFEDRIFPEYTVVATCVNGFFYWPTNADVIISFDLSSDKFFTLPYPDDIVPDHFKPRDKDVSFLELDGSLCLVIQFEKKAFTTLFSFWVYTPSSPSPSPWTRKINLDVLLDARYPLWLGRKNNGGGEFLLLQGFDGALLEHDYTTRELKKIDLMHNYHPDRMVIFPFVENNANIAENKIKSTYDFDGWKAHLMPHSKCGNNDVVDRISQLPDDMILRILSLLSLKEAASTCVLSTRWSDLWRYTPNLNIHDTYWKRYEPKYIKWLNSVVESHKALYLKEFNISFPIDYSTERTAIKCLEFAFLRRVEVLELNLFGTRFAVLQTFLQKSGILKSSNLRSLCLKCLVVSGEDIGLFLRNSPLLERLIIKSAVLTSDLEVCGSALKHLDIQYCIGGKSIKGYAPNLTCLKIDSCPFSLDEVDYHPKFAWATQISADYPPLFRFISSQLTTLEFTIYCPPKGFFEKGFPQMPTLRELIVTYPGHGYRIRLATSLMRAFPYLEEFEIKQCRRGRIEQEGMKVVNNVERFCHRHLKVFKYTWFDVGDGDHMKLMSYILDNCIALQKIILDIYGDDSPSYVAAREYVTQLQSKLPIHIQLIISFNNRQLV